MPIYKYIANRFLTLSQNILMRQKLSEYHTGYRMFSGKVLKDINYNINSDDFIFDNQMLAQKTRTQDRDASRCAKLGIMYISRNFKAIVAT